MKLFYISKGIRITCIIKRFIEALFFIPNIVCTITIVTYLNKSQSISMFIFTLISYNCWSALYFLIFIRMELIYNFVLVSCVQQIESGMHIYRSILFQILFPYVLLQNIEQSSLYFTVSSLVAQSVNSLPPMQETWVQFLCWEDPLEKEMATPTSILAWRIDPYYYLFYIQLCVCVYVCVLSCFRCV